MLIAIQAKCSDLFHAYCLETGKEYDGSVPKQLGIGSGDYVELTFDTETGKITNLNSATNEEIMELFK